LKDHQIKNAIGTSTDTSNEPKITNIPRSGGRSTDEKKKRNNGTFLVVLLVISVDGLSIEKLMI